MKKFRYAGDALLKLTKIEKMKVLMKIAEKNNEIKKLEDIIEQKNHVIAERIAEKRDSKVVDDYGLHEKFIEAEIDRRFQIVANINNIGREMADVKKEFLKLDQKTKSIEENRTEKKQEFQREVDKVKDQKVADMMNARKKITIIVLVLLQSWEFSARASSAATAQQFSAEELVAQINKRKTELDSKELDLQVRERKILEKEESITRREKALEELMGQIEHRLKEKRVADEQTLNAQVKMIASMKPKAASDILSGMNEELALDVMKRLKPNVLSTLFNTMKDRDAVRLNELLAGYRKAGGSGIRKEEDKK